MGIINPTPSRCFFLREQNYTFLEGRSIVPLNTRPCCFFCNSINPCRYSFIFLPNKWREIYSSFSFIESNEKRKLKMNRKKDLKLFEKYKKKLQKENKNHKTFQQL